MLCQRISFSFNMILSSAQLHDLLLLENIKQQVKQLAATVNLLLTKVASVLHPSTWHAMTCKKDFQSPLDSEEELEQFKEWLDNPVSKAEKSTILCVFS